MPEMAPLHARDEDLYTGADMTRKHSEDLETRAEAARATIAGLMQTFGGAGAMALVDAHGQVQQYVAETVVAYAAQARDMNVAGEGYGTALRDQVGLFAGLQVPRGIAA